MDRKFLITLAIACVIVALAPSSAKTPGAASAIILR